MKSRAKVTIALFGGAATLALAIVFGGTELAGSTTTPIATPTSSVMPAPPATADTGAPASGQSTNNFEAPGGTDTGCIPGANC